MVPMATQAAKLGVKPGLALAVDGAPVGWRLEEDFALVESGAVDILIAFFTSQGDLEHRLPGLAHRIFPASALWIAWPRRAAGHTSDLGDSAVREHIIAIGLVDTKVVALDENWSALKVVWRLSNRG